MIAEHVANAVSGATAYTLSGGYAVFPDGSRTLFAPGRVLSERRNQAGRVTRSILSYHDGSALLFTWHPTIGPRLSATSKP